MISKSMWVLGLYVLSFQILWSVLLPSTILSLPVSKVQLVDFLKLYTYTFLKIMYHIIISPYEYFDFIIIPPAIKQCVKDPSKFSLLVKEEIF